MQIIKIWSWFQKLGHANKNDNIKVVVGYISPFFCILVETVPDY